MKRVGPEALTHAQIWRARLAQSGWWHSFELPDGRIIEGANTLQSLKSRLALFPIGDDLTGKRVLDIGAWDGWFSFEMERRGAEVVSVDAVESKNFRYLHRELHSRIDYRILDMYQLSPATLGGTFDIVLFLGVLYHLKHPLLALEKVCALTRDLTVIQTFVSPESGPPVMEFFETDELAGQFDNWVALNTACVAAMARTAGFARAELVEVNSVSSATVLCFRRFPEPPAPTLLPPVLAACVHASNFGINFCSTLDEYASVWFSCDAKRLERTGVQVEIGAFHAMPVAVDLRGAAWQAVFKLPPGLEPGWSQVRVRLAESDWSNSLRIAVDMPPRVESLTISGANDGQTWAQNEIRPGPASVISLWVARLPENRDHHNIEVRLGPHFLELDFIEAWQVDRPSQINARVPQDVKPGIYSLTVSCGGVTSAPLAITCR